MNIPVLLDALTIFLGILFEAVPFILLGVIVSAVIQQFVSQEMLLKHTPKHPIMGCIYGSLIGFLFPVCECGNIPVARRLVLKGVSPSVAISFLLGAPVLNPIVLLATWAAFPHQPEIIWIRAGLSFVIAVLVGYVFRFAPKTWTVRDGIIEKQQQMCNHHHTPGGHVLQHGLSEFFEMSGVMVLGGAIAALSQVIIPRDMILALSTNPAMAVVSMMILAFVISICSNVDSFFALAYAPLFPIPALIGFLVWGPMMDIKALVMLRTTFRVQAIALMCLLTMLLTYIGSMLLYFVL